MSYFINDRHALFVGCVVGIALRNGVPLTPVLDGAGNYTDRLELHLDDGMVAELVVPPPPDDWRLDEWIPE